jgi:hypothetical protein
VDVLWVAVKTYELIGALSAVPSESNIGTIIPLLNGIDHVDLLRVRFGHDYVVPATIAVEAERIAAGQIVQRSPFARLALSMLGQERLANVADRLRHGGFTCEFQADEKTMLWSKLAFLGPFALTGTASDMDKRGIFVDSAWRAPRIRRGRGLCGSGRGRSGCRSRKNSGHFGITTRNDAQLHAEGSVRRPRAGTGCDRGPDPSPRRAL